MKQLSIRSDTATSYTIIISLLIYAFILPSLVGLPTSCLFKLITGVPCPACNLSHAVGATLKLDFNSAFLLNPLVFLLPPFAAYLIAGCTPFKHTRVFLLMGVSFLVIIAGTYVTRLALYFPHAPMSYYHDSLLGRIIAFFS